MDNLPLPQPPSAGPQPPPEAQKLFGVLEWGSHLLGALCLVDALTESLSGGAWRSYTEIYRAYQILLGGYSGTREWEKWTNPGTEASRFGHWFVAAWILLCAGLWVLMVVNWWYPPPVWPEHFTETFGWVIGFYFLGKASGHARKSGWRPFEAARPAAAAPAAASAPFPASGSPDPAPRPSEEDEEGSGALNPDLQAVADAARQAGTFTIAQISKAAGIPDGTVDRHVKELMRQGKVEKTGYGKYRWIGD